MTGHARRDAGRWRMIVTNISRGMISIEDGPRRFEAHGEGLLPSDPGEVAYVVYLNSLFEIGADGQKRAALPNDCDRMIAVIKERFASRKSVVDFE